MNSGHYERGGNNYQDQFKAKVTPSFDETWVCSPRCFVFWLDQRIPSLHSLQLLPTANWYYVGSYHGAAKKAEESRQLRCHLGVKGIQKECNIFLLAVSLGSKLCYMCHEMGTWNASQKQIPAKHIICPKCDFEMDNFELNQVKRDIDICQNFKRKYQPRETVHPGSRHPRSWANTISLNTLLLFNLPAVWLLQNTNTLNWCWVDQLCFDIEPHMFSLTKRSTCSRFSDVGVCLPFILTTQVCWLKKPWKILSAAFQHLNLNV